MLVIKYKNYFYTFSALLIVASLFSFWYFGFNLSIEFKGGSLLEVSYDQNAPSSQKVKEVFLTGEFKDASWVRSLSVQQTSPRTFLARFGEVDEKTHQAILKALVGAKELRFETIGPIIGKELARRTLFGLVIAVIGMFLYVWIAFRKVSGRVRSWKMSGAAILALAHDVLISAGGFLILSYYYGFEVGTLFIAAELTVWGYSINDTIVVFDRIRENLLKTGKRGIKEIAGASISQTLSRSINTSLAVLLLLGALLVIGPSSLLPFVAPLIIGVIIGTYSSICIATPLLLETGNTV